MRNRKIFLLLYFVIASSFFSGKLTVFPKGFKNHFITPEKFPNAPKLFLYPFGKFQRHQKKFLARSENSDGIEKSFWPVQKIPKASKKVFYPFGKFRRHPKSFLIRSENSEGIKKSFLPMKLCFFLLNKSYTFRANKQADKLTFFMN